jgi:hypothetical protein
MEAHMYGELILSKLKIDFISYLYGGCHQLPKRGRLKAQVWFWKLSDTKFANVM